MRPGLSSIVELDFDRSDFYPSIADELARRVRELGVWSLFTRLAPDSGEWGPMSAERFDAIVRDAKNRSFYLEDDHGDVAFRSFRDEPRIEFRLQVFAQHFAPHGAAVTTFLTSFATGFGAPLVRPSTGIGIRFQPDLPYDESPGHPESGGMPFDNIADALDRRIPARAPQTKAGRALAKLLAASVPDGVRRETRGDLVFQFWSDRLTDPDALAEARSRHERWMVATLRGKAGARPLGARNDGLRKPLSFIDSTKRLGFKTVMVFPDGSVDEESWSAARAVASGQIKGFKELAGVYVVVPLREHAIALKDRAQRDGLLGPVYPEDNDLWLPE